jgi:hypothetical protein
VVRATCQPHQCGKSDSDPCVMRNVVWRGRIKELIKIKSRGQTKSSCHNIAAPTAATAAADDDNQNGGNDASDDCNYDMMIADPATTAVTAGVNDSSATKLVSNVSMLVYQLKEIF